MIYIRKNINWHTGKRVKKLGVRKCWGGRNSEEEERLLAIVRQHVIIDLWKEYKSGDYIGLLGSKGGILTRVKMRMIAALCLLWIALFIDTWYRHCLHNRSCCEKKGCRSWRTKDYLLHFPPQTIHIYPFLNAFSIWKFHLLLLVWFLF